MISTAPKYMVVGLVVVSFLLVGGMSRSDPVVNTAKAGQDTEAPIIVPKAWGKCQAVAAAGSTYNNEVWLGCEETSGLIRIVLIRKSDGEPAGQYVTHIIHRQ